MWTNARRGRPHSLRHILVSATFVMVPWLTMAACASEDEGVFSNVSSYLPDGGTATTGGTGGTSPSGTTTSTLAPTSTATSTALPMTGGSCDPNFCPGGMGTPCCTTPNGPCGLDFGMGCQGTQAPADAGP